MTQEPENYSHAKQQVQEELEQAFPWLAELGPITARLVETLYEKDAVYGGSWQKRGGIGAFMMLARKWDRLENIVSNDQPDTGFAPYDILGCLAVNPGDVADDVEDLVCYLLLVMAEAKRRQSIVMSDKNGDWLDELSKIPDVEDRMFGGKGSTGNRS